MNFSMFSCSHFLSMGKPNTMSKRVQERRTGEEPVVAQSRPVRLISRSLSANQSPMLDSGTPYSPVNSDLTSAERSGRDRNENSASTSQVWHKDDNPLPSTERSVREMSQLSSTGGTSARSTESTYRGKVEPPQSRDLLYSIQLRKSSRMVDKKVESLRRRPDSAGPVNVLIWCLFMSSTMKAAVHLGENYNDNLFTFRNTNCEALKTLFDVTQKLILHHNARDQARVHD